MIGITGTSDRPWQKRQKLVRFFIFRDCRVGTWPAELVLELLASCTADCSVLEMVAASVRVRLVVLEALLPAADATVPATEGTSTWKTWDTAYTNNVYRAWSSEPGCAAEWRSKLHSFIHSTSHNASEASRPAQSRTTIMI